MLTIYSFSSEAPQSQPNEPRAVCQRTLSQRFQPNPNSGVTQDQKDADTRVFIPSSLWTQVCLLSQVGRLCRRSPLLYGGLCCSHHCNYSPGTGADHILLTLSPVKFSLIGRGNHWHVLCSSDFQLLWRDQGRDQPGPAGWCGLVPDPEAHGKKTDACARNVWGIPEKPSSFLLLDLRTFSCDLFMVILQGMELYTCIIFNVAQILELVSLYHSSEFSGGLFAVLVWYCGAQIAFNL